MYDSEEDEDFGSAEEREYLAEQRAAWQPPLITSAEQYLLFRESVFLFLAERYLVPRPEFRPGSISSERRGALRSYQGTSFEMDWRIVYSGYGDGGVYRVRLREVMSPRGFHVNSWWRGRDWGSQFIPWKQGVVEYLEFVRESVT